jgi:hypothetical protein
MKDELLKVLKSPPTQTIGFTYTGGGGARYRVQASDFAKVVAAVESGAIAVTQGGAPPGTARYSLRQDGTDNANTFYIGRNNTAEKVFHSLFVHESVHAAYDLQKISMPWLDNEAVAYVAQGFYLLAVGQESGLSEQAYLGLEVAKEIQNGGGDSFWGDALRAALQGDPLYKDYINKRFLGDG